MLLSYFYGNFQFHEVESSLTCQKRNEREEKTNTQQYNVHSIIYDQ